MCISVRQVSWSFDLHAAAAGANGIGAAVAIRFVLLSSAAVTRPDWSDEEKALYPLVSQALLRTADDLSNRSTVPY